MGSGSIGFFGTVHNVWRKESVILREIVPQVKLQRNNKIYLHIKVKGEKNVIFWRFTHTVQEVRLVDLKALN